MSYEQMLQAFNAFNINSFNNLVYIVKTNLWMLLTIVGALSIIVMNVKEEIVDFVPEKINIT